MALLIAAVWLTLWLINRGGDSASDSPATAAAPQAPPAAVPTDGALEVALASNERACDPQKVRVEPTIPTGQPAGATVRINLVVSSTQQGPCTLKPSDADLIAVISANGTAVWDSTQCTSSLLNRPVQLAGGGWATVASTSWSGRGSGGGCTDGAGFAGAGGYAVQVGTLGGEPGAAKFSLEPGKPQPKASKPKPKPKAPKPTASKPEPTPKASSASPSPQSD